MVSACAAPSPGKSCGTAKASPSLGAEVIDRVLEPGMINAFLDFAGAKKSTLGEVDCKVGMARRDPTMKIIFPSNGLRCISTSLSGSFNRKRD